MSTLKGAWALLALLALGGCGDEAPSPSGRAPGQSEALVTPDAWVALGAGEDPFEDRPMMPECVEAGFGAEDLGGARVYAVDTSLCRYVTARQPLQAPILAGDQILIRMFYFPMDERETSHVHIAFQTGELRWEERVPNPTASDFLVHTLTASQDIPAGTPTFFHLHNHGSNEWALIEATVTTPP